MVGWLGLAACLTMVFLAMRTVMDVGGSCAERGPYVINQPCPEGAMPSLFLGIFGGLGFAFMASIGGIGVGGFWAATPVLAWSALFASLGWNFLDYGILNPPSGQVEWGWAICAVLFLLMAFVPLVGLVPVMRGMGPARPGRPGGPSPATTPLSGPGQPARGPIVVNMTEENAVSADRRTVSYSTTVMDGDMPDAMLAQPEGMAGRINEATASGTPEEDREELQQIAADFGAVIGTAMADVQLDPDLRASGGADAAAQPGSGSGSREAFTEGTQALLDRLERLADMRDRGLLGPDEYETAKATVMAELEGRS
jgi:hypothetical protein